MARNKGAYSSCLLQVCNYRLSICQKNAHKVIQPRAHRLGTPKLHVVTFRLHHHIQEQHYVLLLPPSTPELPRHCGSEQESEVLCFLLPFQLPQLLK